MITLSFTENLHEFLPRTMWNITKITWSGFEYILFVSVERKKENVALYKRFDSPLLFRSCVTGTSGWMRWYHCGFPIFRMDLLVYSVNNMMSKILNLHFISRRVFAQGIKLKLSLIYRYFWKCMHEQAIKTSKISLILSKIWYWWKIRIIKNEEDSFSPFLFLYRYSQTLFHINVSHKIKHKPSLKISSNKNIWHHIPTNLFFSF